MSGEFREGFLCPICMSDLGDVIQLQVHFDEKHSREDPDFVQGLKDIFGRAKRKIGTDGVDPDYPDATPTPENYHPVSGIHADAFDRVPGIAMVEHFDAFRAERSKRADLRAMDVNKIIIRLEKLLTRLPPDPVKRRAHEQSVVHWLDEDDVKLCPGCAKSFGLTRRKHHCRLCGGLMCSDCSDLVPFELAERLINPATIETFRDEAGSPDNAKAKSKVKATYEGLVSNLVDLAGFSESQRNFRSCSHCKKVLDKQDDRLRMVSGPEPEVVRYYGHLGRVMNEGLVMSSKYREIAASLNNGESAHSMAEARNLRLQVLKAAETVDAVSKKIAGLPVDPADTMADTLHKRIRAASVNFVKDTLVGLPSIPTEEQFENIKIQRTREANERIASEKKSAQKAKLRFEQQQMMNSSQSESRGSNGKSVYGAAVSVGNATQSMMSTSRRQLKFGPKKSEQVTFGTGFIASAVGGNDPDDENVDPLQKQIANLKNFIQQAVDAGQHDDAKILEANLADLQAELRRVRSEEKIELMNNYEQFKNMFAKDTRQMGASAKTDPTNPFSQEDDDDDELDETNPFSESVNDPTNPFAED